MSNPEHASYSTKCYSAILRRLLCSGSLPTHPSDHFIESSIEQLNRQNSEKSLKPEVNNNNDIKHVAALSYPGVVARLMGLDSFPNTPLAQNDTTLGSFFRSRSVNSIDFFSHFDHPVKQHRRVRTSVSFREEIINCDCISVASNLLEKVDENDKRGRSEIREMLKEKNVIKKKCCKKVEMEEQRRSVCVKMSSHKKDLHGKTRQKLKEKRVVMKGVDCNKEELMGSKCVKKKQNKILAHKVHPEGILPEVDRGLCSRQNPKSRIAQSNSSCSSGARSHHGEVRAITKVKNEKKLKNKESCYYKRMVDQICSLTEEGLNENWMHEVVLMFGDFEDEICKHLGQEILEVLLKQFLDELVPPTTSKM